MDGRPGTIRAVSYCADKKASKGPAAHGWDADRVAGTPALGTLDHSHHRTCPSTWSPERRSPRRRSSPPPSLRWRGSRERGSRLTSIPSPAANVLFSGAERSVAGRARPPRDLWVAFLPPARVRHRSASDSDRCALALRELLDLLLWHRLQA